MKRRVTIKVYPIIVIIVALLFSAAIYKLCKVVLCSEIDGVNLQNLASSIATKEKTLYANRGSILDVNGEELASSVNSYTVIAYLSSSRTTDSSNPKHVVDVNATAKALSPILNINEEKLVDLLSRDKYQVELRPSGISGITERVKAQIEALELPGIGFMSNAKKRYYSQGQFASYIIGYAKNNEEGELVGELGIEGYYDDLLSGTNGYTKYLKYTSSNYQIPNTPEETVEAEDGSDIYLTIDSKIQLIAENTVKSIKDKLSSDWAIVSVIDANTGAIVASATNPNFDPNDTNTLTTAGYLNPLVSYQYEPGSVMKTFSWATAIEEGLYDGKKTFKSGSLELNDGAGTIIRDSVRKGWGTIDFDTGFAYSSNVGATLLSKKIGAETLTKYYTDLGFGSKTGIELANEVSGTIDFSRPSELANAAFGQRVIVSPIQLLQSMTSMTNDGTVIKPYIVDKIVDSEGNVTYQGSRTVVKKVYSSSTVTKMQELMYNVVYKGSNGKIYQPDNVTVMGKTGTAQFASSKGGYASGEFDFIKSFAGIFPVDNPKYIIYFAAKRPHLSTSNKPWGEILTKCIEQIASYANLTQNESTTDLTKLISIDNYISKDVNTTINSLKDKKAKLITIGNGKFIINQYPQKNSRVLSGGKIFLLTNGSEYKMEDLKGWSLSEVKTYCELIGLKLEYSGYGYVTTQSLEPSTIIDPKNNILKIELN